ncbi:hypothetical protein, partial [Escherichia coli]|uniref:hypothetical protein n=1 Tax=Escherichia coli TaxID=562 RepID=UPI0039E0234D
KPLTKIEIIRGNLQLPLVAWNDSIYNIRSDFSLASGGDCKAQLKLNTNSYAYQLQTAITKFSIGILYPYLKD